MRAILKFEEFFIEIDRVMNLANRGHNLDAFNDVFRGASAIPEEGFTIRWRNHSISSEQTFELAGSKVSSWSRHQNVLSDPDFHIL